MSHKQRRLSADKRKPQILSSAIRAMVHSNYRISSMAEIAAEAGISEPAVYRYFPTKKTLFMAVMEDLGDRVRATWEAIIEQSSDPDMAMRRVAVDYYRRTTARRGELKVLFHALAVVEDEDIRAVLRAQLDGCARLLQRLIEDCVEVRLLPPNIDTEEAAWSWLSTGFTLNMVGLLGLEDGVDKISLRQIQRLYPASFAAV
jgi:TetR/AcrR family transcriptional regulator